MNILELVGENQTIKILPSIEETLRQNGLNVDLDSHARNWFMQLKRAWESWKKSDTVRQHIESFIKTRHDRYHVMLAIVIRCDEFKDCKVKTLPFYLIEVLSKWSRDVSITPDHTAKLPAFHVGSKQRNRQFLSMIVDTYQLSTIKDEVLPIVRGIINDGDYKHASHLVIALDLFSAISTEDLLLPLILTDKTQIIDDYLTEHPSQIRNFLQYLDGLLDRKFNIREYAQEYVSKNSVKEVKYDKLHYKPLGKYVARLCNRYKVPIESCHNLSKNRTTAGLRYLIHQKYQENSVGESAWDDLVKDSLKQYPCSGYEFIDILLNYDKKEALKWARYLNMAEKDYPPGLAGSVATQDCSEDETWNFGETSQKYYKLSLPQESVMLVDTANKFHDMMNSDLCHSEYIAIDCEWKPSFGAKQSRVAMIQVAMPNRVYLIDTIVLNDKQYSSHWYMFCKNLLMNDEIIKLGFGIENDLKELKASVVGLNNIKTKGEGLLDICCLWTILTESGLDIPNKYNVSGCSLTSIVQLCFGLPVCKSEQCSNWELRPLRTSQIEYAALDAYVLLEIYEYLKITCEKQHINFDEICNNIMEGKPKAIKKTNNNKKQKSGLPKVTPDKIKFLVEPQVSSLLAYLRYFGIDTLVVPDNMLWHDFIDMAMAEDRFVLTSKMKYSPTSKYPQSHIYQVKTGNSKPDLGKIIKHFNIDITEEFILRRCIYCNDSDIIKMSPSEIQGLDTSNKLCRVSFDNPSLDECDDYNRFLSDSDDDDDLYRPASPTITYKEAPKTSKGVKINLADIDKLKASHKPALLCNACGRFLWEKAEFMSHIEDLVKKLHNLSVKV